MKSGAARRARGLYGERMHEGEPGQGGGQLADHEIVAAIVAGQPGGLAAAYDRYAAALHAYCHTLLGEPADAADAVQDTFIIAASKLGGLRDPARLRPWLYAVARNECRRRVRARASAAPLDEAGEMTDGGAEVGVSAERAELRALVRDALAGLNPGEREIIELNLRHELDGADLADALGVPRNQAHALASRARTQFETSLGALLVARTGREYCAELAAILDGWDGQLTVLMRKRVNRHIERCEVCGDRKRRELSPAMLLSLFPIFMVPPGLRQRVLRLVADNSPAATDYKAQVSSRAEPLRRDGFPQPLDPFRLPRRRGPHPATAGAAAAALLLLGGGGVFAAQYLHGHPAASTLAIGSSSPSPTPPGTPTSPPPSPPPSPSPSATPAPASTPPAAAAPPPATSQPPSPAPKPSHTPKPSPTPSPGTLTAAPAAVRLTQSASGGPYTGQFTLTAQGGPVGKFSISDPGPAGELTVTPGHGSIASGGTVTVTVTAPATPPPGAVFQVDLTVDPGGLTVTIYYPPAG